MNGLYRVSAVLAAVLGMLLWCGPMLLRADLFDGDAAHHIFWLYRYIDADLFPQDLTIDYLRTSAPLGYRALYASLAYVAEPMLSTKLVSAVLFLISAWLAWLTGVATGGSQPQLRGLLMVVGLMVMLALSSQTDSLATMGMQRAFGLPITLVCLWALVANRYEYAGWSWVAAALFYPVLLPVLGITSGIVFLADLRRDRHLPPHWVTNIALGLVTLALIYFGIPRAPELGPATTYLQALSMPEFGPGGRLDLYGPNDWRSKFYDPMTGLGWSPRVFALLVLAVAICWALRRRWSIAFSAGAMLATGLGFWLLLRWLPQYTMFGLYLPNRHPRWAVACFGMIAIGAALYGLVRTATAKAPAPVLRRTGIVVALLAPVAVVLMLLPEAKATWRTPVNADLQNLYRWIEKLPRDTLVAGHPDLTSYVPLNSRHSVLASTETSMPWMLGYYARIKPRLEASLRAAYATRLGDLDAELEPYGVTVMISGPEAWQTQGYLQPFDATVRLLQHPAEGRSFVLREPPADRILFRSGDYYAVRVGR